MIILEDGWMDGWMDRWGGRTLGRCCKSNDDTLLHVPRVDKFYKKCVELREKVDVAIREQLDAEVDGSDKLLKGLTLLEAFMVGRLF